MYQRLSRLACLLMLPAFLAGCQPSPKSTVKGFFNDLEGGEINRATDTLSEEASQLYGSKLKMGLQQAPEEIEAMGGIRKIEITDEAVKGDLAEVAYVIEFGDGSTESGTMELIKEDGDWKINPLAK